MERFFNKSIVWFIVSPHLATDHMHSYTAFIFIYDPNISSFL